jgi:hypothetical protein
LASSARHRLPILVSARHRYAENLLAAKYGVRAMS